MPLSQLDPIVALIVIDLQKGIVSRPTAHPVGPVIGRNVQLLRAFRACQLPVVLVNVAGGAPGRTDAGMRAGDLPADWAELIPELEAQPSDHRVTKHRWGAFQDTGLDAWLRGQGITQVVVTGVATSIGVESTARYASELGYHVVLVTDAMTDLDAEAHERSVSKIFPRMAETTDTTALLAALAVWH